MRHCNARCLPGSRCGKAAPTRLRSSEGLCRLTECHRCIEREEEVNGHDNRDAHVRKRKREKEKGQSVEGGKEQRVA